MTLPAYARPFGDDDLPLPKGGPDRVRFCLWYSDALTEDTDHFQALKIARRSMWMFYIYVEAGIIKPDDIAGGIPAKFRGET